MHHKAVQPIARQIMEGVQQLHDFGIARGTYEGSKGRLDERVMRGWHGYCDDMGDMVTS